MFWGFCNIITEYPLTFTNDSAIVCHDFRDEVSKFDRLKRNPLLTNINSKIEVLI
jgi:hypothetical protein